MTTDFRLFLVTWNVGETFPPKDLSKLLGLSGKNLPNLYAVGLQEMKSSTASRVSDLVFEDMWTSAITDCLSARNYVRIKMRRLLGIHISVYVRRVDLPYITNVESECTKTGLGGFWGNKGALSIRLDAFGVNVCIINAHFTAHCENFRQRLEDYNLTLETQRFRDKNSETILDHDYVFWMGDLNFRIEGLSNEEVRKRALEKDFEYLSKYDQLTSAVKEELLFIDFHEGPLSFPPTFKFDVGTDDYDTSAKNRVPSYCDRVLWRVHEDSYEGVDLAVEQLSYGCVMDERNSDHKPVFSEFTIQVLKNPPELPVMFEPMGSWCQHKDNEVSYLVSSGLALNSRDWIGLYREGYKNWLDYVTYVWSSVKGEDMHDGSHMHTVSFESRYLQRLPPDTYYLLYFSFLKNCVVGYSDGFRLLTTEESSASSSEVEVEEDSANLKHNDQDSVDDFSSNVSLNNSNFPIDQTDSEPIRATVQPSDKEGRRSEEEEEEEPGQEYSLLEYVEPDRSMMKQREPILTREECEFDVKGESLMVIEPEEQALTEPSELPVVIPELRRLVPTELKVPAFVEEEQDGFGETRQPVLDEPEKSSCSELKESVLKEHEDAENPVLDEQKQSIVAETENPVFGEPGKVLLTEEPSELPVVIPELKRLVPSELKDSASIEEDQDGFGEPRQQELNKLDKPLHSENEKPLIIDSEETTKSESEKSSHGEPDRLLMNDFPKHPALDEFEIPSCSELTESVLNEPECSGKPILSEQKLSFSIESNDPIFGDPDRVDLDQHENLPVSTDTQMPAEMQKSLLEPKKLDPSESGHQVLTEVSQPVFKEVKEKVDELPEPCRTETGLKATSSKDLLQSSLRSDPQFEEFLHQTHVASEQSLLENQDQIKIPCQEEVTKSVESADETREQLVLSTEHEKLPLTKPAHHALTDRIVPESRSQLDEPDSEKVTVSEVPSELMQHEGVHAAQSPTRLSKTAEVVLDTNVGACNQLDGAGQTTSDGSKDDEMVEHLDDDPVADASKSSH